jgi:outer membrane protein assembly factor BamB
VMGVDAERVDSSNDPHVMSDMMSSGANKVESVIVLTRDGDDQSALLNFDAEDRALRWRAGSFSRNFTEIAITAGPRFVYVADQGRLTALDRETGEQAWQISLANHLSNPCADCLQYMAGYVVALTRDGTLQSFDGNSGLPAWSRRLRTTPRQMFNVGGQPAVVDADDRNRAVFYLLDRITGVEWQVIQPVCHIDGREHTVTPHIPFLVSSDGLRLHVLGSGSSSCAWRYNLVTGDLEWLHHETRGGPVQVLPFSWSGESYLVRDGVLYTTQRDGREGVLRGVDSQSGLARELLRVDQYELALEVATPTMLVVQATPTFARNEPELWGVNRETGERRWYAQLDISHSFDTLIVHSGAGGIFVGQCLWEDRVCLFEVLDPDSGVSGGQTRQAIPGSVTGVDWAGDTAWMNIWGKIFAVDAATAQVTLTWP